jgi:hypothetical protein
MRGILLVGLVVVAGGCGSPCTEADLVNSPRCSDNKTLSFCERRSDGYHWHDFSCDGACVDSQCVDSSQPVPECAHVANNLTMSVVCWNNRPSGCWDGYAAASHACNNGMTCTQISAGSAECR